MPGVDLYVIGLTSEDDPIYKKHKKIVEFCKENEVSLPTETAQYFKTSSSRPECVDIEEILVTRMPSSKYEPVDALETGLEINVADIPTNVSKIRFIANFD